jgi:penicillin G amidase
MAAGMNRKTKPKLVMVLCLLVSAVPLNLAAQAAGVAGQPDSIRQGSLSDRARAALSQVSGALKVDGLQEPVNVLRDRWGLAHIYAQNQHDLFFAQGFVAAQDRLFQMELWKRSGQGRLAEILGPSALQRDVNARLLSYRGDMKLELESYSPDTREILESFTQGINAYIASRTASGGQGLPLEFQIAGFQPEPWKPIDCLNRMAAFSMTGNAFAELAHAQATQAVGAEAASSLFDFDPPVRLDPAPGADLAGLSPALLRNLVGSDTRIEFPKALQESNNWTVSGKLTRSGKPLLANDPHRVIAEPSLRYMVHLVAPGWDVIGAGEPGLPGVALGHNQNIAWGFTTFGLDQQDLYLEDLNPADPSQYRTAHGWDNIQVRRESFGVRGSPDVQVELKFTNHGPVLWQDGKRALALHWVCAEPGTAGYLGSLAVDRAQNWQDFEAAVARWKVPSENIVYADRKGNIGEHSVGLAPLRKEWTGLLPVPGAGRYEWSGFVATQELPHQFNPAAGFVATANHKMIPEGYPQGGLFLGRPLSISAHYSGAAESQVRRQTGCGSAGTPAVRRSFSAGAATRRASARRDCFTEANLSGRTSIELGRRGHSRIGGRRAVRSLVAGRDPGNDEQGSATGAPLDDRRLVSSSSAWLSRSHESAKSGPQRYSIEQEPGRGLG